MKTKLHMLKKGNIQFKIILSARIKKFKCIFSSKLNSAHIDRLSMRKYVQENPISFTKYTQKCNKTFVKQ